ncbi:short chain amide porin [Alteromonadaceae bacterium Bs31]|nr:short chain amide porin [Alteromonadaceae bacterium Bs31]
MRMYSIGTLTVAMLTLFASSLIHAGPTIELNDEASLKFVLRVQGLYLNTDSEIVDERDKNDFKIRRARLQLIGTVNPWLKTFIQTEYAEDPNASGSDMRLLDARIQLKKSDEVQAYIGQFLVPSSRMNATLSDALMTIDYPGITYKSLSWGNKAVGSFANRTINTTGSGLAGTVNVRDVGVTFWGQKSLSEKLHLKYYLGTFDGARSAAGERYTARATMNIGDPEAGFLYRSTYLGKKDTLAIGTSYDIQNNVARDLDTGAEVNYAYYTVDLFAEKKLGEGVINFEGAYQDLDLGDAGVLAQQDGTTALGSNTAKQSQGSGYYAQAGYLLGKWQPWLGYETWQSDAPDGAGNVDISRIGISYFFQGHTANVKLGYEQLKSDTPFSSSVGSDDKINTLVLGFYLNF